MVGLRKRNKPRSSSIYGDSAAIKKWRRGLLLNNDWAYFDSCVASVAEVRAYRTNDIVRTKIMSQIMATPKAEHMGHMLELLRRRGAASLPRTKIRTSQGFYRGQLYCRNHFILYQGGYGKKA
jgi:hypothetical protein